MSQPLHAETSDRLDASVILASGYDELTRVDQALRDAERRLAAAHNLCSVHGPERAQELYREVLALRHKAKLVLAALGEIWVADR